MRVLRSVLAAAITLAVLAAPVSAAPASTGDYVWGGGVRFRDGAPKVKFGVAAIAPGGQALGLYTYQHLVFDLTFSGAITCFDVAGNQAAVGGVITNLYKNEFAPTFKVGDAFLVFFIDGQSRPDAVTETYIMPYDLDRVEVPGDFPNTCPNVATTDHLTEYVVRGNFVVTDN